MMMRKTVLPLLLSTIWISVSEFVRNEFIVKSYWIEHYEKLGITFPSEPVNGAFWGIWSLFYAISIFIVSKKFNLIQTTFLSWFFGFVLMWIVVWNMGVFPPSILVFALPLSLIEAFLAGYIIKRLSYHKDIE
jgi:hypothetical protein